MSERSRPEAAPQSAWHATESIVPPVTRISFREHAWTGEPVPIAHVVAILLGDEARTVVVKCPYCNRRHVHGLPPGSGEIGHRAAHCVTRTSRARDAIRRGYWVDLPDGAT